MRPICFGSEPWHETRGRGRFRDPLDTIHDPHACHVIASTAALVGIGLASAAGGVASAAIGAHAAGSAADKEQAAASKIAADAKAAADKAAAGFNTATATGDETIGSGNQTLTDAQAQQLIALKPYIDAGLVSLSQVQDMLSSTGELATNKFGFSPQDYANDPSFRFLQENAQRGIDASAASKGALFTGGTARETARVQTGLASTYLDSAFNRKLAEYNTNRQSVLDRIQALTGITNLGFSATGLQNQDIGNTAAQINANENRIAANQIAAGKYSGDVGLDATRIAAQATAGAANAGAAADIAGANAINSGISTGLRGILPVLSYGLPGFGATSIAPGSTTTGSTLGGPRA